MKHYTRRVITSVKVFVTPEQTNTSNSGLFAIAAVRGGSDTTNCSASNAATINTNSDTDVMTMKAAVPFRIYDNLVYDASWAIAGGDGPKQNEFNILNSDTSSSTVVGTAVDGVGLSPCCIYMGGSCGTAATSGTNVVTHRVIVEMTMHLLDYRGTIAALNPMFKDKPPTPTPPICDIEDLDKITLCKSCDRCSKN